MRMALLVLVLLLVGCEPAITSRPHCAMILDWQASFAKNPPDTYVSKEWKIIVDRKAKLCEWYKEDMDRRVP